ncbi:methionine ABC transporter permease [Shouchella shacheensis]|uniref:methionine ABC transporter permease n=1 Tax=Shouchella shacheensis TaxID=1649580 RepID=UPI00074033DD|nr:methionine ABC transporter permease [Shouchella shacheensis]
MIEELFPNVDVDALWTATWETIYMTGVAALASLVFGLILGVLLFMTAKGNAWQNKVLYTIIGAYVNIFRSIPFLILIILLIPLTSVVIGTIRGPSAALPALIIGSAPFYARLVEIALREVDKGVIEAAQSMGASNISIIVKVLIPESMPALLSGITVTAVTLVGYTAMAGAIGAGGLGTLALQQGFQRTNPDVTLVATIVVLIIVFIIQWIGDLLTRITDKR